MRAAEGPLDYPEIWRFLFDVYGIRREGGLEPRDYHPRIQAGEVIACTVGSLLCEGDVRRLTGVRYVEGTHDLMAVNPHGVLKALGLGAGAA